MPVGQAGSRSHFEAFLQQDQQKICVLNPEVKVFEYLEVVADRNRALRAVYRKNLSRLGVKVGDLVVPDVANCLGLAGWELVSVISCDDNVYFYFKRQMSDRWNLE